jgi:hypothetical protein
VICSPAVILLSVWAVHWGGLAPPNFKVLNGASFNLAVPVHAIALTGLWALPFALPAYSLAGALNAETWRRIAAVSLISFPLWLASPTTWDIGNGRWGSVIWEAAAHSPHLGRHSVVVLGFIAIGIAVLAAMLAHAYEQSYFPAETLLLPFYFIGYSAQPLAWQRYVEPQIFLTLAVFSARLPLARPSYSVVPAGLAIVSAAGSVLHVSGAIP